MSNTQKRIEKDAKDFVRGDTCEVMDTYSAHEDTFKAGAEFGLELEREKAAGIFKALMFAEVTITALTENMECRGDEDCDHCEAERCLKVITDAIKKYESGGSAG